MPSVESRVARLEERSETTQKLIAENIFERRRNEDKTQDILKDIQEKLDRLQWYGAGVATVSGAIGAGVGMLWDKIVKHL